MMAKLEFSEDITMYLPKDDLRRAICDMDGVDDDCRNMAIATLDFVTDFDGLLEMNALIDCLMEAYMAVPLKSRPMFGYLVKSIFRSPDLNPIRIPNGKAN